MNQIHVIAPYYDQNTYSWVFDDARFGLTKEPFVSGIPAIIEKLTADVPNARSGFILMFSAAPFAGFEHRLLWEEDDLGGNWYRYEPPESDTMYGWLCPAMFHYLPYAPACIYIAAEPIPSPDLPELEIAHADQDHI